MVVVRRMCAVSILDTRRSVKNKLRNLAESLQVTQLGRQIGSQNFGGTSYSCGFFFSAAVFETNICVTDLSLKSGEEHDARVLARRCCNLHFIRQFVFEVHMSVCAHSRNYCKYLRLQKIRFS